MLHSFRVGPVSHRYSGRLALDGVVLEIPAGITAVVGANGSGKSTLFQILTGLRRASSRPVETTLAPSQAGFLPQVFAYPKQLRVADFVAYAKWLRKGPGSVSGAIEAVGLGDESGKRLGELSGGMLRRAGLAAVLVCEPDLLVLDEPTTGVDPVQRRAIRELIAREGERRSVLLSSHIAEDVEVLAGHVVVLARGSVAFQGTPARLLAEFSESRSMEEAIVRAAE